ncbi:MAG: SDR family NAD(P)-dependent oxidoreductase, partial [Terrimonas sp.]|nr:SDR family NAD(P)-dependent oxidoreductase [Terrimonas sp.]
MGLSTLGILHTIIGIVAIVAAIVSYGKFSKINLNHITGKIYFYCTVITSFTALGLSKLGGFNPGHVFALFIVVLVWVAYFLYVKKPGHNKARYFENFLLSFSFFLSWVPTINETFTRVPVGKPLAKAPTDPVIAKTLFVFLILFITGSIYQFIHQRKINKKKHFSNGMKTALITGANQGIGFETARQLAKMNYYIYLGSRNLEKGLQAVEELKSEGLTNVELIEIDVTDTNSVKSARQIIESKTHKLDLLINNAGIAGTQPQNISTVSIENLKNIFETNFFGAVQTTQQFIALLKKSNRPTIINVSSPLGSLTMQSNSQNPNHRIYDAYSCS